MLLRPNCPDCGSEHTVKNGRIHKKKPKYKCQSCGRQFVENPTKKVISSQTIIFNRSTYLGEDFFGWYS
jgi:insertion element IS1 protein InsB